MNRLPCIVSVILLGAYVAMAANDFSLPLMEKIPCVDGVFSADEWNEGICNVGLLRGTGFISSRKAQVYFGLSATDVYFACCSELPPEGMDLISRVKKSNGPVYLDDSIELILLPPNGTSVYQVIANYQGTIYATSYPVVNGGITTSISQKWYPEGIKTYSGKQNGKWIFEMRIPRSAYMLPKPAQEKETWRCQFARDFHQPNQQTSLTKTFNFVDPEQMAIFTVNSSIPYVSAEKLECDPVTGMFDAEYKIFNPTSTAQKVNAKIGVISDGSPRELDTIVEIAPRSSSPVALAFSEKVPGARILNADFTLPESSQTIFSRQFQFDPFDKVTWQSPARRVANELDFGVYPYYRKIRAQIGTIQEPAIGLQSVSIALQQNGQLLKKIQALPNQWGFEAMTDFEPKPGTYQLTAALKDENGKTVIREKNFEINSFAWEHNTIGDERIIIPPYKPLTRNSERNIYATCTGVELRNGFFDKVSALDTDNILAAPITLKINGETLYETSFRFTDIAEDRICYTSTLKWQDGTVTVDAKIDYDGFCDMRLTFSPNGKVKIHEAALLVPLKREIAQMVHATCNKIKYNDADFIAEGDGVVWRSSQTALCQQIHGNFHPYFWFGDRYRGIAWMSDTDRYWSLDYKKDALDIIRTKEATVFRVHIVNKPTTWSTPFTLRQALQPTPTCKQPDYMDKMVDRTRLPNTWKTSSLMGSMCFGGGIGENFRPFYSDYSFINYLRDRRFDKAADLKVIDGFMERNAKDLPQDVAKTLLIHLNRGIAYSTDAKYLIPYINARSSNLKWPEYQTYMDEWWCSEFRANNADAYNITPTRSYQDCMLFYLQRMLREGLDGLYFDNIRDWPNANFVTGPAYRLADGSIQPYFDLFDLRDFVKRTVNMLYKEGKTLPDGRPYLVCHMTNCNLVPILSLAAMQLDLEAQYGSTDFHDRFSDGYYQACSIGTQTGTMPQILVMLTGKQLDYLTRTFLSTTIPWGFHNVMVQGGLTSIWRNTWSKIYSFGYGTPEVEVISFDSPNAFPTPLKQWRTTTYSKKGEKLVVVSNFGDNSEAFLDVDGAICTDEENGQPLSTQNGKLYLAIPKHDFRIFRIK